MDTGFDRAKTATVPPRDSVSYLNRVSSPDFEGRYAMRELLVGAVQQRIKKTLLGKDGRGAIQFSDQPYRGDPSIEYVPDDDTNKGKYILRDSAAFWKMLDERPQDFTTDCLNVIPITIIGAMRDVLIERGYASEAIDRELSGTVFHGEHTAIKLGQFLEETLRSETTVPALQKRIQKAGSSPLTKKQLQKMIPGEIPDLQVNPMETVTIRPFEFDEVNVGRDPINRCYSPQAYGLELDFKYNDDGIDPELVTLNVPVREGDLFYTRSEGVMDRDDVTNADCQNGIILSDGQAGDPGTSLRAYGHDMENVADRDTSVGIICRRLGDQVKRRKMSMEDYIAKGGISAKVISFDYVGLYAALAANLTTHVPKTAT